MVFGIFGHKKFTKQKFRKIVTCFLTSFNIHIYLYTHSAFKHVLITYGCHHTSRCGIDFRSAHALCPCCKSEKNECSASTRTKRPDT